MYNMSSKKRSREGFDKRKRLKRRAVLDSAIELFSKHGTEKVSIAEIASSAHVSPVTIYNHFGSKEDLILSLVRYITEDILGKYKHLISGDASFPKKVEQIFRFKLEQVNDSGWSWIISASSSVPTIREVLIDFFEKESKREILKLVNEGKEQGFINSELSDKAVIIFLEIFMSYLLNTPELMNKISTDESLMRQVYSMFWWGLDGKKWEIENRDYPR